MPNALFLFYRARNRRAAFLRRVNGTLCAGYSCHSRVSTYELSHIYAAHSYRERDINTRARCKHVHIHPRCVTPYNFPYSSTTPSSVPSFPHSFFHCYLLFIPVPTWKLFIYLWNTFRDSILSTYPACPPFICLFVLYLFTSLPFSSFLLFLISLSSFLYV